MHMLQAWRVVAVAQARGRTVALRRAWRRFQEGRVWWRLRGLLEKKALACVVWFLCVYVCVRMCVCVANRHHTVQLWCVVDGIAPASRVWLLLLIKCCGVFVAFVTRKLPRYHALRIREQANQRRHPSPLAPGAHGTSQSSASSGSLNNVSHLGAVTIVGTGSPPTISPVAASPVARLAPHDATHHTSGSASASARASAGSSSAAQRRQSGMMIARPRATTVSSSSATPNTSQATTSKSRQAKAGHKRTKKKKQQQKRKSAIDNKNKKKKVVGMKKKKKKSKQGKVRKEKRISAGAGANAGATTTATGAVASASVGSDHSTADNTDTATSPALTSTQHTDMGASSLLCSHAGHATMTSTVSSRAKQRARVELSPHLPRRAPSPPMPRIHVTNPALRDHEHATAGVHGPRVVLGGRVRFASRAAGGPACRASHDGADAAGANASVAPVAGRNHPATMADLSASARRFEHGVNVLHRTSCNARVHDSADADTDTRPLSRSRVSLHSAGVAREMCRWLAHPTPPRMATLGSSASVSRSASSNHGVGGSGDGSTALGGSDGGLPQASSPPQTPPPHVHHVRLQWLEYTPAAHVGKLLVAVRSRHVCHDCGVLIVPGTSPRGTLDRDTHRRRRAGARGTPRASSRVRLSAFRATDFVLALRVLRFWHRRASRLRYV